MKHNIEKMIGTRVGSFTVTNELPRKIVSGRKIRMIECLCDCGNKFQQPLNKMLIRPTMSCGCRRYDGVSEKNRTHGLSSSRTYSIWHGIVSRCTNPKNKRWNRYGGRGISVCKEWMTFSGFLNDMGEAPEGMQIDREDNDGDYCKNNCRWTTPRQQQNNKSTNRVISLNGDSKTLSEWAETSGIHWSTIRTRIESGWKTEDALTLKPDISRKYLSKLKKCGCKMFAKYQLS